MPSLVGSEMCIRDSFKYQSFDFKKYEQVSQDINQLLITCMRDLQRIAYIQEIQKEEQTNPCLLYTSDAADDMQCVDLGGRRIIKKKKQKRKLRNKIPAQTNKSPDNKRNRHARKQYT
eukprot:TRINITY_DN9719_c0_g1_i2.p2 TRINITY_DN9719_c0_g1~~TRINITY_DN9719_c0_g1_i2.p2  ORF type:complete len:118 (+),score=28.95 TRINITY_DN9719_c0_g1_i2:73-426(+)